VPSISLPPRTTSTFSDIFRQTSRHRPEYISRRWVIERLLPFEQAARMGRATLEPSGAARKTAATAWPWPRVQ
jgi:hypothetical protein